MSRRTPRGGCGLLVLAAVLAGCDAAREDAPPPPPAVTTTLWHTLGTWSGRGSSQTESFDVTTGSLRLTWDTRPTSEPGGSPFVVALHSAISGRPLQTVVETEGPGSGTVSIGTEPRVAYLRIDSEGTEWRLTLDEGVPSPGG